MSGEAIARRSEVDVARQAFFRHRARGEGDRIESPKILLQPLPTSSSATREPDMGSVVCLTMMLEFPIERGNAAATDELTESFLFRSKNDG